MGKRVHKEKNDYLYKTWKGMNHRCRNPNNPHYHNYGGRGIFVCEKWDDSSPEGFENFCQDMGPRPKGTTLDRINNDKGYYPKNCRWASQKEQTNNTRRNRVVNYYGEDYTVSQLAEKIGIKPNTLEYRLLRGWDVYESTGDVERPRMINGRVISVDGYSGKFSDEQLEEIDNLNDGTRSAKCIGDMLGVSQYMVYNYIRYRKPKIYITDMFGEKVEVPVRFSLTAEDVEDAKTMLLMGKTKTYLAEHFGVSASTITNLCKRLRFVEWLSDEEKCYE